jgi:hypothetical protein
MTHDQTLSEPICYVVIGGDCADCRLPHRHHHPPAECGSGQRFSAFQTRLSVAVIPLGGCGNAFDAARYAQLRLAVDVVGDLGGYPHVVPNAAAARWRLVALTGPDIRFNRVGTDLLHRLGAGVDVRVCGPLVLHAAPDSQHRIGSLPDLLLRRLAAMTSQVVRCIEGATTARSHDGPATPIKENPTPWTRPGHAAPTSSRRSYAAIAAAG